MQSMFSHIEVYMNNKLISENSNNYPWKAYLKVILSSGSDEQNSQTTKSTVHERLKSDKLINPQLRNGQYISIYQGITNIRTRRKFVLNL